MARLARHDILFEPVQIGPKTLRNRFYQVPHCTGFGVEKPWTQAAFRGMKAEGGWAAVCTEYCSISAETDESPYVSARLWDDEDARALRLMTEEAHRHGALAGVELWHGGLYAETRESRLPPLAPSPALERLRRDHGSQGDAPVGHLPGAGRVGRGRPPRARRRLRHRLRLRRRTPTCRPSSSRPSTTAARTATAARSRTAPGSGSRRSSSSATPSATTARSRCGSRPTRSRLGGRARRRPRVHPPGRPHGRPLGRDDRRALGLAAGRRRAVAVLRAGLPARVVGAGPRRRPRSRSSSSAASPTRTGWPRWSRGRHGHLIGAARPSISDPFLPRKIEEGRYDEIRECIGCNACYSRSIWGRHLGCTQNATAGEEHRRGWHPGELRPGPERREDGLVVGAGPAGMECAIVLAKRGLELVHLVDAGDDIGGCLRWVTRLPGLGEWGRMIDYRRVQIERLPNLEFVPNTLWTRRRARLRRRHRRRRGRRALVADGLGHHPLAIPGADADPCAC